MKKFYAALLFLSCSTIILCSQKLSLIEECRHKAERVVELQEKFIKSYKEFINPRNDSYNVEKYQGLEGIYYTVKKELDETRCLLKQITKNPKNPHDILVTEKLNEMVNNTLSKAIFDQGILLKGFQSSIMKTKIHELLKKKELKKAKLLWDRHIREEEHWYKALVASPFETKMKQREMEHLTETIPSFKSSRNELACLIAKNSKQKKS